MKILAINMHNSRQYETDIVKLNNKKIINSVYYPNDHQVKFTYADGTKSRKHYVYAELDFVIVTPKN